MIGEKIKELRREKGISQVELSKNVSVAQSTLGTYERGDRYPDSRAIIAIADYFNVSTDYLLGLTEDRHKKITAADELGLSSAAIDQIKALKEKGLSSLVDFLILSDTTFGTFSDFINTLNKVAKMAQKDKNIWYPISDCQSKSVSPTSKEYALYQNCKSLEAYAQSELGLDDVVLLAGTHLYDYYLSAVHAWLAPLLENLVCENNYSSNLVEKDD